MPPPPPPPQPGHNKYLIVSERKRWARLARTRPLAPYEASFFSHFIAGEDATRELAYIDSPTQRCLYRVAKPTC